MKKEYIKPLVIVENFSLSTNIAGNCGLIVNNSSENVCAYNPDRSSKYIFTSTISACITHEDDGEYEGICYHAPTEAYELFNS